MKIVGLTMRGFVCALLSIFVLSACGSDDNGGGGGAEPLPTGVAARIEIVPSAVLLTEPGQTKTLIVRVFDADGVEIKSDVQWESTHPEQVSVDASGVLKASGAGGSSQITAHMGTVNSLPLLAVHTKPPAEAVLLTDANIVGEPEETTPGAAAAIGNTYTVKLIDIDKPAVGSLLINTEGKIVAGRVTEVSSANGQHNVTLALVPAREMFPALDINEVFDLTKAEVVIPEALLEAYDVQKDGDTYTFTPKPTGGLNQLTRQVREQALEEEFKLGPFDCKLIGDGVAGGGSQVVALTVQPSFSFTLSPSMDVLYTQANGLERFVLHAEPNFTVEGGLKVLVGLEAKVTCDAELAVIKLPVGGPIAFLISGLMPIGVGMELGGKLTVADMGISAKAQAKTTLDLGLACPDGAECSVVHDVGDLDVSFEPSVDGPSVADVRVEPSLSTYSFVKIAIGNPFLKSLRFNAFVVKSGAALKGSFAPQLTQVADTSYKSDYKLIAELKAGVDTGFKGLAAFMGLNSVAETVAEINTELGTSPTGTLTADAAEFVAGDTVNFTVKMDPSKVGFLPLIGPYNVQRILLLRVEPPSTTPKEVASVIAMSDQTEFTIPFEATTPGKADEFYAFVVTTLLPVDLFSLELGQATVPPTPGLAQYRVSVPPYVGVPVQVVLTVERADANGVFAPLAGARVILNPADSCSSLDITEGFSDGQGQFTATLTQQGTATQSCDHVEVLAGVAVDGVPIGGMQSGRIKGGPADFIGNLDLVSPSDCAAFSHLTTITGILNVRCGTAAGDGLLPNLRTVDQVIRIAGRVDLPALTSVNSMGFGPGSIGTARFPALVTARSVVLRSASELTALELPNLTQLSPGKLELSNNVMLGVVDLGTASLAGLEIANDGVPSLDGITQTFTLAGTLRIANNTRFSDQAALDFANSITWTQRPDDPIASGNIVNNTGP